MDWSQILPHLQGQGPVFWAAAAAAAAGAALLAGAGVLQWRRTRARRPGPSPRVQATADGYTAQPPVPAVAAVPPLVAVPAEDPRLAELGSRLAAAAIRLEELQARRVAAGTSALKTPPDPVEYVHRSARA
ncbi:MAG: hypothetical protein ABR506_05175 [Candidatus Krumholzibacteriia bacterium]